MGLDMYAYRTDCEITEVDFDMPERSTRIATWYKHANLHGWMSQIYEAKGGFSSLFNCNPVQLDRSNINNLARRCRQPAWCKRASDHKAADLAFIKAAREAIEAGDRVYYCASW